MVIQRVKYRSSRFPKRGILLMLYCDGSLSFPLNTATAIGLSAEANKFESIAEVNRLFRDVFVRVEE